MRWLSRVVIGLVMLSAVGCGKWRFVYRGDANPPVWTIYDPPQEEEERE